MSLKIGDKVKSPRIMEELEVAFANMHEAKAAGYSLWHNILDENYKVIAHVVLSPATDPHGLFRTAKAAIYDPYA